MNEKLECSACRKKHNYEDSVYELCEECVDEFYRDYPLRLINIWAKYGKTNEAAKEI